MIVKDYFGNDVHVYPTISRYAHGGGLCIQLWAENSEPWATMTVNLDDKLYERFGEEYAYVDVNNFPEAIELIERYNLAENTGCVRQSGFVQYPLYRFDLAKLVRVV